MLLPQPQFPFDDQTWIISDTHFFHENIDRYCDRPDGWQETIFEALYPPITHSSTCEEGST